MIAAGERLVAETREHLGLVRAMPHTAYLEAEGLSVSGLRALARSPYHFHCRSPQAPTEPQALGTLVHCLVLEPQAFDARYAVGPEAARNSTEWRGWSKAYRPGVIGLKPSELGPARLMAMQVRSLPEVAHLLAEGEPEVSIFWREPVVLDDDTRHVLRCKARADWAHAQPGRAGQRRTILMDLKTTRDASPRGFARSCFEYGYHLQAAHYSRGWAQATGDEVLGFVFAVVESEPPHAAVAYMLDEDSLEVGARQCAALRHLAARCERSGQWPGYASAGLQTVRLPAWAFV